MVAKNPVTINLEDGDYELFLKAVDEYDIGKSGLLKEIVHAWLFANKLSIKRGKAK